MSPIEISNKRNNERNGVIKSGLKKLASKKIFISLCGDDGRDVGSKLTNILLQKGLSTTHLEDNAEHGIADGKFPVSDDEVFILGEAWSQKETTANYDLLSV